jgi:outer membrane protein TolC
VTSVRAVLPLLIVLSLAGAAAPAAGQGQSSSTRPAAPLVLTLPQTAPPVAGGGVFLGGVPAGTATSEPIKLTVIDAIVRALEHNLGVLQAEQAVGRAQGTRWRMLSELLPNVNARFSETRQKINLQAFGFGTGSAPLFPGFPMIVGPFNVFDARVYLTQPVLDLSAINDARSASHSVAASQFSSLDARNFVVHVVATLYIQALAASARVDAAQAQLDTATALYNQAVDLKKSGMVAGIDTLRAEVQLNLERQRRTAAQNDFEKAKLVLARAVGLPTGQAFALDPQLPDVPSPDLTLEQAVEQAFRTRPDYQAALERVRAAESNRAAVVGSALPSVHFNADYGAIGLTPSDARTTYTVVGAVNVPIFEGRRTHGKLLEADAELRNRRAEFEDLKAAIYYDVRSAFLDLQSTREQLDVATRARDLAAQELTQARDRFVAGVGSNIEVVEAQQAVAIANEQFISAQYGYALAKAAVIRGVGATEDVLRRYIGGTR